MAGDVRVHEVPTRRETIEGAGAIVGGGLLAGCDGDRDGPTALPGGTDATDAETPTETSTAATLASYEVSVEPAGRHTFDEVPETYATIPGAWLDLAMALGVQPKAVAAFDRLPLKYYDALPDVTFDTDAVRTLGESAESQYDKEVFYDVDADVHLMDPRMLKQYSGWDDEDLAEIESEVGPIIGSTIRFPFGGRDPYYTLYEALEKAAAIFQRRARYEAWLELKESVYAEIESRLPATGDDVPTVAAFNFGFDVEGGQFYAATIDAPRNDTRTFRLLGVNDAFADEEYVPFEPVDAETLLAVDPEYIGLIGYLTYVDDATVQSTIEAARDHDTLGELQAVQAGNVLRTGGQYMGPIVDLFSAEALAKQLYPEAFGEWPGAVGDVPAEERLFDRQRVADVVNGVL